MFFPGKRPLNGTPRNIPFNRICTDRSTSPFLVQRLVHGLLNAIGYFRLRDLAVGAVNRDQLVSLDSTTVVDLTLLIDAIRAVEAVELHFRQRVPHLLRIDSAAVSTACTSFHVSNAGGGGTDNPGS